MITILKRAKIRPPARDKANAGTRTSRAQDQIKSRQN